jgi:hypothetical protein
MSRPIFYRCVTRDCGMFLSPAKSVAIKNNKLREMGGRF